VSPAYRFVPVVLAAALVAGNASASTNANASFCTASKSVVHQLVNTASALSNTATLAQRQAELKTQFTTIKSAEPSLRSSVPRKLKPKLTAVLGFVDLVNTKLGAVNWNLAAIMTNQAVAGQIEAASSKADAAMPALKTYYTKTCHYKI
jgi:hypothetical protein